MPSPEEKGALCSQCPLQGNIVVPSSPAKGKLRLVVISETPNRYDEKLGLPLQGAAGQLTFDELSKSGIPRDECHVTQACLCSAEGSEKDLEKAVECCRPRLLRELDELPSDVPILTLGKSACYAVLNTKRLMYARGFVWKTPALDEKTAAATIRRGLRNKKEGDEYAAEIAMLRYKLAGRTVIPTLHPAFVLRADPWLPVVSTDVRRAGRAAGGLLRQRDGYHHKISGEPSEIRAALQAMGPSVAADIETDGINVLESGIVCLGISDGVTGLVVYPWNDVLAGVVQRELEKKTEVVFHNHTFDVACLTTHGMRFDKINVEDSMVGFHAFASHLPKRLDFVTPMYCDFPPWKLKFNRHGTEEKGGSGDVTKLSPEDLCLYNIMDCYATIAAWHGMQENLRAEKAVYDNDMALSNLCMRMQREGVAIDGDVRATLSSAARGEELGKLFRMRELTWPGFNPRVPKHVRRALFGQFGLRPLKGTPTGFAATDKGVLTAIAGGSGEASDVARCILDYRYAQKLRSTYIDGLELGLDGRLHPTWRATGTVSGRLSSSPLHQMPHGRRGYEPRDMIVAGEGKAFVYFDVGQAEMRFAAYLSQDKKSIEEVEQSDCYVAAAKTLFAEVPGALEILTVDPKGKGKNLRQLAKMARLAANYLIVADSLYPKLRAAGVKVEPKQVERILQKIHSSYSTYFRFVDKNIEQCRKLGWLADPILGRKRRLGFNPSGSEVANFPIQAGIAAIMTIRLLEIDKQLDEYSKILVQVHDSCIIETPLDKVSSVMDTVSQVWSQPVVLSNGASFRLPVDLKSGLSMGSF